MAKPPPRLKIKRASVVVNDAGVKRLAVCESCGEEKYIVEGQTVCDECKSHSSKVSLRYIRAVPKLPPLLNIQRAMPSLRHRHKPKVRQRNTGFTVEVVWFRGLSVAPPQIQYDRPRCLTSGCI
jgi:hypothetical protein